MTSRPKLYTYASEAAPERGHGIKIVQSWDIATTTDERNDYSVWRVACARPRE